MSTYLAIRGVTETLRLLLDELMDTKNDVTISVGPPDLEPESDQKKRLNLYLYKIVENAYLKNQEIPGEGHTGAYGHPPLSLVLYYLLTAFPDANTYNKDYDLTVHEILGDAMRVFHDYPILTDSMEIPSRSGEKLLRTSLQNQFEKVKIILMPLDTEELTKIWMGLTKPYRLSVGYAVSVVQIESKKLRQLARLVKTRRLHTMQFRRPHMKDISTRDPDERIEVMPPATARIGDELMIRGSNFLGVATQVMLNSVKIPVTPTSDDLITLTIPDNPAIQPGVQSVGVTVKMAAEVVQGGCDDRGETISGEIPVTSNQMALMVVPKITDASPAAGDTNAILTVEGDRLYKEGLKTAILVGDRIIEVRKPGASDSWNPPTATRVQVPLTALRGLLSGKYPIRIRVNGAESLEEDQEFELTS